ncbi:MAG: hypothetical protein OXE03_05280, partial [Gammaproteobacteria bacterium]|nr:hypothetical protein [Gammaproteobacteria bacterium]
MPGERKLLDTCRYYTHANSIFEIKLAFFIPYLFDTEILAANPDLQMTPLAHVPVFQKQRQ